MSRNFQKKNKDLVNLQVVPSSEVWERVKTESLGIRII